MTHYMLSSTFANFGLLPKWESSNSLKLLELGSCVNEKQFNATSSDKTT